MKYNNNSSKLIITSAAGHTKSNHDVGHFPDKNHEEADSLMIQGVSATERSSKGVHVTFNPDTDVMV